MLKKNYRVGILGLGYVGMPLFNEIFNKKIKVVGYDKSLQRINFLKKTKKNFKNYISNNSSILKDCNVYLVCVPTPVNNKKKSNLNFLKYACLTISKYINKNDIIIFESTVYPGITKKFCLPLLKKNNKSEINFFIGYAPERLSPGDNKKIFDISKIVAAEDKKIGIEIKKFYKNFIKKVYLVKSIEVAELAKNFENCQRDLNIALMNDLYMLCERSNIDPYEVISACKTKWNFGDYYPGLVGGHCISIDPYYLIEFGTKNNFDLKTLKTSRNVNEKFIFDIEKKITNFFVKNSILKTEDILFIGGTYKKNIDDFRNSGALKIFKNISKYYTKSILYDPYEHQAINDLKKKYKAVIILVFHDKIKKNNRIMKIIYQSKFVIDIFQNLKK
jgi:UDP-N-acetyl-D-glucosamine/UDP-N-acetyl-D-galactosamine dehydrogenase